MPKKLTPQDQELWESFTKDVRRIKHDTVTQNSPKIINTPEKLYLPMPKVKPTQKVAVLHANELRTMQIDGQLDLHGFTQTSGEVVLREFLKAAVYKDWRWVRIITGKGSPNNPSILREKTPKWLQTMPELVTGYAFATHDDGGTGAFYVKIRRKLRYR
jgi:DNA-nicking Smr family endonuclease